MAPIYPRKTCLPFIYRRTAPQLPPPWVLMAWHRFGIGRFGGAPRLLDGRPFLMMMVVEYPVTHHHRAATRLAEGFCSKFIQRKVFGYDSFIISYIYWLDMGKSATAAVAARTKLRVSPWMVANSSLSHILWAGERECFCARQHLGPNQNGSLWMWLNMFVYMYLRNGWRLEQRGSDFPSAVFPLPHMIKSFRE